MFLKAQIILLVGTLFNISLYCKKNYDNFLVSLIIILIF